MPIKVEEKNLLNNNYITSCINECTWVNKVGLLNDVNFEMRKNKNKQTRADETVRTRAL